MVDPFASESRLVAPLMAALGGVERILAVRTFARDEVRTIRDRAGGTRTERVLTFRKAGGNLRIETFVPDGPGPQRGSGAGRTPLAAGAEGAGVEAAWKPSTDSVLLVSAASSGPAGASGAAPDRAAHRTEREGRAPFPPAALETALRETALEPRNLLAHLPDRRRVVRDSGDGTLIELPDEGILYTFDLRTGLCRSRHELREGVVTRYRDWRGVGGIASSFVETREGPESTRECRVLGIAYDLPLPDSLFASEAGDGRPPRTR